MSTVAVRDLISTGVLRIEDGNHGNDRPRPEEFVDQGVAFIRAADMTSGIVDFAGAGKISQVTMARIRKGVGAGGDVILSHKGTVGRIAVAPANAPAFVCSPQTTFWRSLDPSRLDPTYLRYAMLGAPFQRQLATLAGQTDMAPYVSLTDQRSMTLDVPTIGKQRAIAEVLGALDDKIAANKRASDVSVQLIAAHYDRTTGPSFEDVGILEVLDVDFGEPFRSELFSESGIGRPLARIRDLKACSPQVWTTESRPRETVLSPGDVVVGMDGEFRAAWWLGDAALVNQRVFRARGKGFGSALVAAALRAPLRRLEGEKSATTVIHLNKSDLARSVIRLPIDGRAEFELVAEPLLAAHVARSQESRVLAATRDELLPLLMSGKVRVRDAEKRVEGVL